VSQVATGAHQGIVAVALIGVVLLVITQIMGLVGAWQMTRGNHNGRRLFIQAIVLILISSLIYNIGLANPGSFIAQVVLRGLLYFVVVISRFPDEAPSATREVVGGPPPS
jgi:hypothetical protein